MKKAVILDWFGVLLRQDEIDEELVAYAKELKGRGMKIFVLSNADESLAQQQVAKYQFLSEVCDKFYYSGKTGFVKPDLRAYQLILEENNLKADEVIYFDDNVEHVAAAQALGIESYVFESAAMVKEKLK